MLFDFRRGCAGWYLEDLIVILSVVQGRCILSSSERDDDYGGVIRVWPSCVLT